MNELQTILESLSDDGSWGTAIIYGGTAFIGFLILSALMRSAFLIMLGAVAAFYIFSLQTPKGLQDIASEKTVYLSNDRKK